MKKKIQKTVTILFCRQNNHLNIENACEAGRCSLTYSVCCAESPQFNYKPNFQSQMVSKNSASIS